MRIYVAFLSLKDKQQLQVDKLNQFSTVKLHIFYVG